MLAACGGRTLDDGAYDAPGSGSNADGTCRYNGVTVANGTLVADPCVCFCDNGQFQCQSSCDGPGSSVGGASVGGGGPIAAGASSLAGSTQVAGATGATTGGAPSGGFTGVAGASGIACGPVLHATSQLPLIDDMEDGDGRIAPFDGRNGVWFAYNDGTPGGMQFPSPSSPSFPMFIDVDPLSGGHYVAATYGSGFTTWGVGIGLVFTSWSCPYDASVFKAVRFYARSDRPMTLSVLFPTADTNPPSAGGACQELTGHSCFDSYQAQVRLDQGYQKYYVDFASLTQQGWGQPVVFDSKRLIGINFQIPNDAELFTVMIDDVTFY
jgi:hypothetical protein